jgi:hypothetical protein
VEPREYLWQVATSWWNLITALGAALAILSGVSGVHTPWWLWLALIIGGLLLAQYQAFQNAGRAAVHRSRNSRRTRDADASQVRSGGIC